MDGATILCIEMALNKAYTALFGVSTQDFFNFIKGDPSLLAGIPTLERVAAYGGGFPIKVDGEIVGAIGLRPCRLDHGAHCIQNRAPNHQRMWRASGSSDLPGGSQRID